MDAVSEDSDRDEWKLLMNPPGKLLLKPLPLPVTALLRLPFLARVSAATRLNRTVSGRGRAGITRMISS